MKSESRFL